MLPENLFKCAKEPRNAQQDLYIIPLAVSQTTFGTNPSSKSEVEKGMEDDVRKTR